MNQLSDEELIKSYLGGNHQDLEVLIRRYLKPIYFFVFRSLGNKDDANDLVQNIFIKIWENIAKFDLDKKFKPWAYKIAKNAVIDFSRRKKVFSFSSLIKSEEDEDIDFVDTIASDEPSILEMLEKEELKEKLNSGLQKLNIKDRTLLLLYNEQNITFREIAEIWDESVDTVKSRYRRALEKLRNIINNI